MGASGSREADNSLEDVTDFEERMTRGIELSRELMMQEGGPASELAAKSHRAVANLPRRMGRLIAGITRSEAHRRFTEGLKGSSLFQSLNDEIVDELFAHSVPVLVVRDQTIVERNSIGQIMFIVVRGSLKAVKKRGNNPASSDKNLEPLLSDLRTADFVSSFEDMATISSDGDESMEMSLGSAPANGRRGRFVPPSLKRSTKKAAPSDKSLDSGSSRSRFTSMDPGEQSGAIEAVEDRDYQRGTSLKRFPSLARSGTKNGRMLKSGHCFGSHCVLLNVPHTWTVTAQRDTLLFAMHRLQFQEVMARVSERNKIQESAGHRIEWLERFPFLGALPDEQLELLARHSKHRKFAAGERIISRQDVVDGMYIVLTGTMAVIKPPEFENEFQSVEEQRMASRREKVFGISLDETRWYSPGDALGASVFLRSLDEIKEHGPIDWGIDVVACIHADVECLFLDWASLMEGNGEGLPLAVAQQVAKLYICDQLQSSPLFTAVQGDALCKLVSHSQICTFAPKEVIVARGQPVDPAVYFLLHGAVVMEGVPANQSNAVHRSEQLRRSVNRISALISKPKPMSMQVKTRALSGPSLASGKPGQKVLRKGLSQQNFSPHLLEVSLSSAELIDELAPYVLLMDGDVFGEESVEFNPSTQSVSVTAVGSVVCARVPVELLEELAAIDRVRHAYYGTYSESLAPEKRPSGFGLDTLSAKRQQLASTKDDERKATFRMLTSFSMCQNFLLLRDMLEFDESQDGTLEPRHTSLVATINGANLLVLTKLHDTKATTVYLALHALTLQLCVVKRCNVGRTNSIGKGPFALTEPTIMSQLDSPFITRLLSSWAAPPSYMMVALEPVLGGQLDAYILARRRKVSSAPPQGFLGCFQLREIRFICACMVLALKHLNEKGICHRDFKAVNIMIDHNGFARLTDFGISKQLQHRYSRTSTFIGTPRFMAPEVANLANGHSTGYGLTADWWSFGCVVYMMATGHTPFDMGSRNPDIDRVLSAVTRFGKRHSKRGKESVELVDERRNDPMLRAFNDDKLKTYPGGWEILGDFCAKLLNPNPLMRLGGPMNSPRDAMTHPLFQSIPALHLDAMDWTKLEQREVTPPLTPGLTDLIVDLELLQQITELGAMPTDAEADAIDNRESVLHAEKPPENRAARLGLAQAMNNMNQYSVQRIRSVASAERHSINVFMAETSSDRADKDKDGAAMVVEEALRAQLEEDPHGFLGTSLLNKRIIRQQNMLANQRRAKILELKHSAAVSGSLASHVLRRAAVAEAIQQMIVSNSLDEDTLLEAGIDVARKSLAASAALADAAATERELKRQSA